MKSRKYALCESHQEREREREKERRISPSSNIYGYLATECP